jgi:RNA polymerase sigma-70 factor (ECF subfamily)
MEAVTRVETQNGNGQQFETLMESTYSKVYAVAYRMSGSQADAEDLTQEAFFRAYRSFDSYEGDRPFENWILKIVSRLFLDLLRSRRRRVKTVSYDAFTYNDAQESLGPAMFADPEEQVDEKVLNLQLDDRLEQAIKTLSKDQQNLIQMAYFDGLSYDEMAEKLEKPVGTIRSRLHRIHRQLARTLKRMETSKPIEA